MSANDFILNKSVIVLDGGTGTELGRSYGFALTAPRWSSAALREDIGAVVGVHTAYLNAGAQIITTATFRSNISAYLQDGLTAVDSWHDTVLAVKLAKQAIAETGSTALVAGSMAPILDCYGTELPPRAIMKRDHQAQAAALVAGGADFLVHETVPTITEAKVMAEASEKVGAKFAVNFTVGNDGRLLDGSLLSEAARATASENRIAVGVNCSRIGDAALAIHELLASGYAGTVMLYPNGISEAEGPDVGGEIGNELGWNFSTGLDRANAAARFVEAALALVDHVQAHGNKIIIGGCCGVTPVEIRALADELAKPRAAIGHYAHHIEPVAGYGVEPKPRAHAHDGCCHHHRGDRLLHLAAE